jgi:hypothetical protein
MKETVLEEVYIEIIKSQDYLVRRLGFPLLAYRNNIIRALQFERYFQGFQHKL